MKTAVPGTVVHPSEALCTKSGSGIESAAMRG